MKSGKVKKSIDGPGPFDWLKAIGKCNLCSREKLTLFGLIGFVEYGKIKGACHPAVSTIADRCSCGKRTVQRSLRELERVGVLSYRQRSHGRMAHEMLLDYQKLKGLNPANQTGSQSKGVHTQSCQLDIQHRQAVVLTPPTGQSTPSDVRPNYHEPSIELPNELESVDRLTDGMDGEPSDATRKRHVIRSLKAKGVQGKNLDRLAASSEITVELIEREWNRLNSDSTIRNSTAALVQVLADLAGIDLGSKQVMAGFDPAEKRKILDAQARIEELRRDAQRAAS